MENTVLSLIIPIYNSSRFLKDCLDSVLRQLQPGVEVILVNDGSTDASVDVIKRHFSYNLEDKTFILIDQINLGPGPARNAGLHAANGDYIGFMDSDDLLCPGYLSKILELICKDSPDILQFNVKRIPENWKLTYENYPNSEDTDLRSHTYLNEPIVYSHTRKAGLYDMDDVRLDIFGRGKWFPVSRVFKKEIIKANKFPQERVFYEDLSTIPFIFLFNYRILLIDDYLIYYRNNSSGTTRNHTSENLKTLYDIVEKIDIQQYSLALSILKIQVARGIVYFSTELDLRDDRLVGLLKSVKCIKPRYAIIRNMGKADNIFFAFPYLYSKIEKIRHRFKR